MNRRMILGWMLALAAFISATARADEPPITIRVLARDVDGSPLNDAGVVCRSMTGPVLGRCITDPNGSCTFEVVRPIGTLRLYLVPAAVKREENANDTLAAFAHFKGMIETRAFPAVVAVELADGDSEYEVVLQAHAAVKVTLCQPGTSERQRKTPQVMCPSSRVDTVVTNLEGGCFEIRGVPRGETCDLILFTDHRNFGALITLDAETLAENVELGMVSPTLPEMNGQARITYEGQWMFGISLTLLSTNSNWVMFLSPARDGSIRQYYNGPSELQIPVGEYILLPGLPGEMPEHAKVFAARRQGLALRDAGLPILEVAAGTTAVLHFDPKQALEAAAALPVAP